MNNTYIDLVQQTFNFPQKGLNVKNGYLEFNGLDTNAIVEKNGTPFKLSYLHEQKTLCLINCLGSRRSSVTLTNVYGSGEIIMNKSVRYLNPHINSHPLACAVFT